MTKNMDYENTIQARQSIRTRVLALILGLTFLSMIVIVYVSINSILSAGQDAQVVGNDILQNQAEEFLVQVTTDDARWAVSEIVGATTSRHGRYD